jgi:hypothetical protein
MDWDVDLDAIEAAPVFEALSDEELLRMIEDACALERKISAERAILQAQLDILRVERLRRSDSSSVPVAVLERLADVLAWRPRPRWRPRHAGP